MYPRYPAVSAAGRFINGLKIVLAFHPLPTLPPQGGGTSYNCPLPWRERARVRGIHLCLYYYETVNNNLLDSTLN